MQIAKNDATNNVFVADDFDWANEIFVGADVRSLKVAISRRTMNFILQR